MASFEQIEQARKILNLGEAVSSKEIKQAYRKMVFQYHSDTDRTLRSDSEKEEMMKKINWAYKLLLEYCGRYKYTFTKEDWKKAYPEEAYYEKYVKGWFDTS